MTSDEFASAMHLAQLGDQGDKTAVNALNRMAYEVLFGRPRPALPPKRIEAIAE